jgi:hypothetical protein
MRSNAHTGTPPGRVEQQMSLLKWVLRLWPVRLVRTAGSRIIAGYKQAPLEEKHGYRFWGPVALLIAFFEIGAATAKWWRGRPADWPTISSAVGHLETSYHAVAVVVVAVITLTAFYALAYGKSRAEGLKERAQPDSQDSPSVRRDGSLLASFRNIFNPYRLFSVCLFATLTTAVSLPVAYGTDGQLYRYGYALYGSLAFWGILLPLILKRWRPSRVKFPTLFATIEDLREHSPTAAVVVLAGLAVLVIHLALYPWPDVSHESTGYAGLSTSEARARAEAKIALLRSDAALFYTSQVRGHTGPAEQEVWLVYFNGALFPAAGASGCVVAVSTDVEAVASPECSA